MNSSLQDLRFGIRTLMRNKVFTLVAVLSIALGIAVNATVFGWLQAVLFNPLPGVTDGSSLVIIKSLGADGHPINSSYPDLRDIRQRATTLSGTTAFVQRPLYLGEPPKMEGVWGQTVGGEFFDVLGVKPILGRTFSTEEINAGPGGAPVIVIGESAWRSRFRADPSVIGRNIQVNRRPYQVIGVVPASFHGAFPGLIIEYWIPIVMEAQLAGGGDSKWMDDRGNRPVNITGRLKPGFTPAQAKAEVAGIAQHLAREYPRTNEGIGAAAFSLPHSPEGAPDVLGPVLKVLLGITAMVLLIVCANVGNLLLARAASRHKEFGVRLSLGASRGRLIRQLMAESLLLSAAGAALGLLAASWMSDSIKFLMPASDLPAGIDWRLDATAVLFMIALCALTTVFCGLAPALQFSRYDIQDSLRQSGRGNSGGPRSARLRGLLVASEVSMAVVALIGAGLFMRSFERARNVQPGFDPKRLLLASADLASAGCKGDECIARLDSLRRRFLELPGVTGATVSDYVPLGFADGAWDTIKAEGYVPRRGENTLIHRIVVGPGYFETMRIPLVAGRFLDARDDHNSLPVAVVNEAFAQRFYPGVDAVGRRFDT
jgi:predicted permease